jgi:hypothetical protein
MATYIHAPKSSSGYASPHFCMTAEGAMGLVGSRTAFAGIISCCLFVALCACSKAKLSELVDKTKEKVSSGAGQLKEGFNAAADTTKEQLNLAGTAQVKLDTQVEWKGCYATFTALGEKRPAVLQIRSYSSPKQESFPSMLLRASVKAAGTSELVGQVVPAQLYMQTAADSPIYFNGPGSHVDVKIIALDDKSLTAEIVSGSLRNTHRTGQQPVTGNLSAVWQ